MLFCIFAASKAPEGHSHLCRSPAHGRRRRWAALQGEKGRLSQPPLPPPLQPLTFFSGGSLQPESFTLWRSWNLILTSSMLSWSRSQKLARSWEEGWG